MDCKSCWEHSCDTQAVGRTCLLSMINYVSFPCWGLYIKILVSRESTSIWKNELELMCGRWPSKGRASALLTSLLMFSYLILSFGPRWDLEYPDMADKWSWNLFNWRHLALQNKRTDSVTTSESGSESSEMTLASEKVMPCRRRHSKIFRKANNPWYPRVRSKDWDPPLEDLGHHYKLGFYHVTVGYYINFNRYWCLGQSLHRSSLPYGLSILTCQFSATFGTLNCGA